MYTDFFNAHFFIYSHWSLFIHSFYFTFIVFTYRYFLHRFPQLCIFAVPTTTTTNGATHEKIHEGKDNDELSFIEPIGCVVCKIDPEEEGMDTDEDQIEVVGGGEAEGGGDGEENNSEHSNETKPRLCGYMAMLAVDTSYRRSGIGSALVKRVVRRMRKIGCSSVTLETEVSNKAAMRLYEERLGFVREEFFARYYLNWGDAYRLKLYFHDNKDDDDNDDDDDENVVTIMK